MALFKCKMCGGDLEITQGMSVCECQYCGTKQTLPNLDGGRKENLYDRANHFRRNNEYDKAMSIFEQILNEDTSDAEAYWSLVLCKYGIEYVEDPTSHKRIPTVHRTQTTSIFADEDYKSAIVYADDEQKAVYEAEAKAIDEIQKGILEISNNEDPFDVFVCYKESDANGKRTPDSVLANDLYHQLTQEGFKVFYAAITLEDKLGSAYEPYIFAALNSAKVMVALGTKPEYFNAVWVKNEWSRYLALIKNGENKMLIPAYKDMDPYDLPEEFSHLQAQDMAKLGFMQDLIRGIKKILSSTDVPVQNTTSAPVPENLNVEKSIKRIFLYIEDGKNNEAEELIEKVIDAEPENTNAYLAKLIIEANAKTVDGLVDSETIIADSKNLDRAIRFADDDLKAKLVDIKTENTYRNAHKIYDSAASDSEYLDAKKLFEKIPEHKDSQELIEQCNQKSQSAKIEQTYIDACALVNGATAVSSASIDKINKAISMFESVIDYEDSEKKVDECKRRIEKIKAGIEANKKKTKKIAIIAGIAIAVVIAFIIVLKSVIIPASNYNNAISMMESGDYDNAIDAFEAIGAYKDAEEKITECQYKKAEAYFKDGKYKEASEIYEKISDYNDSKEKYNESIYQMALAYYNDKDLDNSNPLFGKIKNYKDSANKIHYHDWKKTKTVDATCTDKGSITYKCSCGETKSERVTALGHDWQDATCTKPKKCNRCGETSGSALGHTDGVKCERCGKVLFETISVTTTEAGVVKTGISLPAGTYQIKVSYSNAPRDSSWAGGKLCDSTGRMIASPRSADNGETNSESFSTDGIEGGYIETAGVYGGTCKIVIEVI